MIACLLLSSDLELSVLLPDRVGKIESEALVSGCDYLVKCELNGSNELLSRQVVGLCVVIHVIALNQEGLCLLEEVVNGHACDEHWVQIIINALCSAYLLLKCPISLFLHLI